MAAATMSSATIPDEFNFPLNIGTSVRIGACHAGDADLASLRRSFRERI
jgi:hypothetical protein